MHRSTRTIAIGSAMALAALAAVTTPAVADDGAQVAALGLGGTDRATARSPFFAGYADTGVGSATTRADFRVPEFACGDTDAGVVTTLWAIDEEGNFLAGPDLFMYCENGEYVLSGHVTTSGGQIPIWQTLEPGDMVRLSIEPLPEGSTSTHEIAFTNLTRDWTSSLPTNSPIERIEVAHRRMSLGGTSIEPPDYGKFHFSNVRFDNVRLIHADAQRYRMVDAEDNLLINARNPHGDNFKLISKTG